MNLLGEPAFVGRHCGSNEYEITRELIEFYSEAIDDRNPLYGEIAPPLVHHSECYQFGDQWYLKNVFGNLHARQDWEFFAPIRVGSRIRSRSTIVERYRKRGRDYVVNETDLVDAADGRLLVRGRTHQSFMPPEQETGGFVVDESTATKKKKARPPFPTATGPELPTVKKTVDASRCWMFSGPGKNYHTDVEEAKKLGFPNIVVQGMMATCFVAQVMLDHFGRGFAEGGKMSLKLTNVLWVDEAVTTRAKVRESVSEGTRNRVHCDVWSEKDDGSRILIGEASALES